MYSLRGAAVVDQDSAPSVLRRIRLVGLGLPRRRDGAMLAAFCCIGVGAIV